MASSSDHSRPILPKRRATMEVQHGNLGRHEATIPIPATHAQSMQPASPLPFASSSSESPPYFQRSGAGLSAAPTDCKTADRPNQ